MADDEVVILEAEDKISPLETIETEEASNESPKPKIEKSIFKNKKILILVSSILILFIIIFVVIIIVLKNKKPPKPINIDTQKIAEKLVKKEDNNKFSSTYIDNMIQKANLLYEKGQKEKALKIYKQIATYNEGLSFYNIGVAKMKEKNYQEAIKSFKKAIINKEQKCKSSINAAVCALYLKSPKLFKYYIDLAYTYLPDETNSPLYSYQMSLINYYRNFYYEALSTFEHPSSKFYINKQKYIASKILSLIGNNQKAIDILLSISSRDTNMPLGLLYARIGEFSIAKKLLLKTLNNTDEPIKVKMALALVENRLGNLKSSATFMDDALRLNEKKAKNAYPIEAILKPSIFNVNLAQKDFAKELFFDNKNAYSLIFYFSPYKIFDATQSIRYIRKGSMSVFLNKISPALSYLKASSSISKINTSMVRGIKKALSDHILQANIIFKSLLNSYPEHSILHYNLALTYAELGDYLQAYKHFSTSYHLDNKNYLSGVYAIFCGKLLNKDISKLSEDVKASISLDKHLPNPNLYTTLINLSENNQLSLSRWIENDKKEDPLHIIFDVIISQKISNQKYYRQYAQKLKTILPNDLLSNIIYFDMNHSDKNIKEYAKAFQVEFKNNHLDFDSFYFGPKIVKTLYTKLLQISGLLFHQRKILKAKLPLERDDPMALTYTLAYLDIFTHNFEESYVLYNRLIDKFKRKDSNTIFLAAVAAIGAKHTENAIALLELSKLINPKNWESRYALGLMYQQTKNFKGANIQYAKIGDSGFKSKFFSFILAH